MIKKNMKVCLSSSSSSSSSTTTRQTIVQYAIIIRLIPSGPSIPSSRKNRPPPNPKHPYFVYLLIHLPYKFINIWQKKHVGKSTFITHKGCEKMKNMKPDQGTHQYHYHQIVWMVMMTWPTCQPSPPNMPPTGPRKQWGQLLSAPFLRYPQK